ncbi:hypothetical protein D3C78_1701920 [compost metagenome]
MLAVAQATFVAGRFVQHQVTQADDLQDVILPLHLIAVFHHVRAAFYHFTVDSDFAAHEHGTSLRACQVGAFTKVLIQAHSIST